MPSPAMPSCYALPNVPCPMLSYAMPCHAMLCHAMLCYATLCYAMLGCAMLCHTMRCHVVLFTANTRHAQPGQRWKNFLLAHPRAPVCLATRARVDNLQAVGDRSTRNNLSTLWLVLALQKLLLRLGAGIVLTPQLLPLWGCHWVPGASSCA